MSFNRRFFLGSLLVDPQQHILQIQETAISDDRKLLTLLTCLANAYPNPVAKQTLLDSIWGDVVVSEASLTKLVSNARQQLRDNALDQDLIKTVHRKGYRLTIAPHWVTESKDNESAEHTVNAPAAAAKRSVTAPRPTRDARDIQQTIPSEQGKSRQHHLIMIGVFAAILGIAAFTTGALWFPHDNTPKDIYGRWHLIDNTVVRHAKLDKRQEPYCKDTVQYYNARVIKRDDGIYMTTPLAEIPLGTQLEIGHTVTTTIQYNDGTGTTNSQITLRFDSPTKITGKSIWSWSEQSGHTLCQGVSSLISER